MPLSHSFTPTDANQDSEIAALQSADVALLNTVNAIPKIKYDQTARPANPANGDYWQERSAFGQPLWRWYWDAEANVWISEETYNSMHWWNGFGLNHVGPYWNGGLQYYWWTRETPIESMYRGDGVCVVRSGIHSRVSGAYDANNYPIIGWMPGAVGSPTDETVVVTASLSNYTSNANPLIVSTDHKKLYAWVQMLTAAVTANMMLHFEPYYKNVGNISTRYFDGLFFIQFKLYRN